LDLVAQLVAQVFEELGHGAHVGSRLEDAATRPPRRRRHVVARLRRGAARSRGGGGPPRDPNLDTPVPVALLPPLARVVLDLLEARAGGMRVEIYRKPALTPEQLVDGHNGALALDVPKRLVHAAEGVVQDRPVAPVRADVTALPDVLDVVGIPADQE